MIIVIDHPDCTVEELINQFGSPEDIAKEFLDETSEILEPKDVFKTNKKLKTSIVALTLFLAISIVVVIKAVQPTPMQPAKEINIIDKTQ